MARFLLYLFLILELVLGVVLPQYLFVSWSPLLVFLLALVCHFAMKPDLSSPMPAINVILFLLAFVLAMNIGYKVGVKMGDEDWMPWVGAILGGVVFTSSFRVIHIKRRSVKY